MGAARIIISSRSSSSSSRGSEGTAAVRSKRRKEGGRTLMGMVGLTLVVNGMARADLDIVSSRYYCLTSHGARDTYIETDR